MKWILFVLFLLLSLLYCEATWTESRCRLIDAPPPLGWECVDPSPRCLTCQENGAINLPTCDVLIRNNTGGSCNNGYVCCKSQFRKTCKRVRHNQIRRCEILTGQCHQISQRWMSLEFNSTLFLDEQIAFAMNVPYYYRWLPPGTDRPCWINLMSHTLSLLAPELVVDPLAEFDTVKWSVLVLLLLAIIILAIGYYINWFVCFFSLFIITQLICRSLFSFCFVRLYKRIQPRESLLHDDVEQYGSFEEAELAVADQQ